MALPMPDALETMQALIEEISKHNYHYYTLTSRLSAMRNGTRFMRS